MFILIPFFKILSFPIVLLSPIIDISPIFTFSPIVTFLEIIELTTEEVESLRLKNMKDLDQVECAKLMKTSQSTFQRILSSAYKKIAQALTEGKAIKIIK